MAVKSWDDHVELVEEGGVMVAKSHKEFTVVSWDELAGIDVNCCLQGSIVYNISDGKIAVWDGTSEWIEPDGTVHEQPAGNLVYGYMLIDFIDFQTQPDPPSYDEIDFTTLTPVVEGDEITVAEETAKMLVLYAKSEAGMAVSLNENDYSFSSSAESVWTLQANGAAICGALYTPSSGQAYLYLNSNEPSEQLLSFHVLFESVS